MDDALPPDPVASAVAALATALSPAAAPPGDARELTAWLEREVQRLLDTHPAHLMSILYRVDVRERDVKAALTSPHPAAALADALLARQIEKLQIRRHYSPDPHAGTDFSE